LTSIIQIAVEIARPTIDEFQHELAISLPTKDIVLDADSTRLAQTISNLLNNAAKYMEPGGVIELVAQRHENSAVVSVKDSGIGIPPAMLGQIFELFTQVDRSREYSSGGLGIGLTLVKRLVEMHEGTVEALSDGPGKGSEFIIRLPIAEESPAEAEVGDDTSIGRTRKHRILVADDNENAATLLAMLLDAMGNEVRTAHDGQMAFQLAEEFRPDIVILDLGMPKVDGYETARQIRQEPWGKEMILAALTGWGQEEVKRRTKEAGFDHHFVKPVEPEEIQMLLIDECY
jgi:CheY-like chemotaxis protein